VFLGIWEITPVSRSFEKTEITNFYGLKAIKNIRKLLLFKVTFEQ